MRSWYSLFILTLNHYCPFAVSSLVHMFNLVWGLPCVVPPSPVLVLPLPLTLLLSCQKISFTEFILILLDGFLIGKTVLRNLYTQITGTFCRNFFYGSQLFYIMRWSKSFSTDWQLPWVTEICTQGNWCPIHFLTRKLFSLPVPCPGNSMIWVSPIPQGIKF